MKNIRIVLPENLQFLEAKFYIYLNRRVFVMLCKKSAEDQLFYFHIFGWSSLCSNKMLSKICVFSEASLIFFSFFFFFFFFPDR